MINLEFTLEQVNTILSGLGKLPYEAVFELVDKIRTQAQQQIDEKQKNQS